MQGGTEEDGEEGADAIAHIGEEDIEEIERAEALAAGVGHGAVI
ncbi:hypothetical protein BH09VER1_BH09VER1_40760 [soil metagenome]